LRHEEDVKNEKVDHADGEHKQKTEEIPSFASFKNAPIYKITVKGRICNDIGRKGATKAKSKPENIVIFRELNEDQKVIEHIQARYHLE